ncbi:MAG: polysaccharide lyase family 1 protein [Geminicoccaceae bacterium]
MLLGALVLTDPRAAVAIAAFPGAEGFGAEASGGRGGEVRLVTTLDDSGKGSLRACLGARGPRICVFRIGGTIVLDSPLTLASGDVTIAGQTAPGDGILLRAGERMAPGALLRLNRDNVVLRHLRLRRGAGEAVSAESNDVLQIRNARDVMIDHVSVSWGVDENVAINDSSNITVQWSVIAEGLLRSNHPKGPHGDGMLIHGDGQGVSLHHNLFVHNNERNPRIKVGGVVDLVNNIIYNPGSTPTVLTDEFGKVSLNYIGNSYLKGPDSPASDYALDPRPTTGNGFGIHALGNLLPGGADAVAGAVFRSAAPFPAPPVDPQPFLQASAEVLQRAGAQPRDEVDLRLVRDVRRGTGRQIDSPSQVGGWPDLAGGAPYPDADRDGMDDRWEAAAALDPADPSDRNEVAAGGYTNLDRFLSELAGDRF